MMLLFRRLFQGPGVETFTSHTLEILLLLLGAFILGLLWIWPFLRRWKSRFLKLETDITGYKKRIKDFEAERENNKITAIKLKSDIAGYETRVGSLENEKESLLARLVAQESAGSDEAQEKLRLLRLEFEDKLKMERVAKENAEAELGNLRLELQASNEQSAMLMASADEEQSSAERVSELEAELASVSNQYVVEIDDLKAQIDEAKAKATDWNLKLARLQELEQYNAQFSNQIEGLNAQIAEAKEKENDWNLKLARLEELEHENRKYSAEVEQLGIRLSDFEQLQVDIADKENRLRQYQTDLEAAHETSRNKQKELDELQGSLQHLKQDLQTTNSALSEAESKVSEAATLRQEFIQLQTQHEESHKSLNELSQKFSAVQGRLSSSEQELVETKSINEAQQIELDRLRSALSNSETIKASYEQQKLTLGQLEQSLSDANRAREKYQHEIEAKDTASKNQELQIAGLKSDLDQTNAELSKLKVDFADVQRSSDESQQTYATSLAAKEKDIAQLQRELADTKASLTTIEDLSKQLAQASNTITETNGQLRAKESELSDHIVAIDKLKLDLDTSSAENGQLEAELKSMSTLPAQIESLTEENERLKALLKKQQEAAPLTVASSSGKKKTKKDDLKIIEGIGPKTADLLKANGIDSLKKLSKCSEKELRKILSDGGDRFKLLNPGTWAKQAKLATDGKWDELQEYQDYLIGGVEPTTAPDPFDRQSAKAAMGKPIKQDDLTIIEGIGPKISGLIKKDGIKTWRELSKVKAKHIKGILDNAGPKYQMHNPSTWPKQAKLAADGKWKKLKDYQDILIGGVEPSVYDKERFNSDEAKKHMGKKIELNDLTIVEGIGPKINGLLNEDGIKTWRALATAKISTIQSILDAAGPRYQIHDPATWPKQARLAADGKWTELIEYQDYLDGGKDPG